MPISAVRPKFVSKVVMQMAKNTMKRGICSLGLSVNPDRMNVVGVVQFPETIVFHCTALNELLVIIFGSLFAMSSIITILISYVFIILTVVRIHFKDGKYKAFSTCTSHLMAVSLFHGTLIFMYLRPVKFFSFIQHLASLTLRLSSEIPS
ncbi:hypothetical protein CIB84_011520 [Bambusicola thoracicus]|uniref:G-protein coupled receptors family 1 profile domain-containing protein n=1 Tax=Bambusicola thoracicus TaxID=9083 RepID=A0A2P4SKV8_BAMTH|nr:hypothetical protein CIB84_011520 [Bambusicola thoracicus]